MNERVDEAVAAIERDLRKRKGLGNEWDEIDDETREEIRMIWGGIIETEMGADATDPRELGGAIAGPGGPYDEHSVVFDIKRAVLLEGCEVAILGGVRDGVLDRKPISGLVLRGRINKSDDRVQALYLMNEDGAAGIVTQLIGLASRAGWGHEFVENFQKRLAEMPM